MNYINTLIIGNGFDLANSLPTKYSDFLKMCEIVRCPDVHYNSIPKFLSIFDETERKQFSVFCMTVGKEYYNEFSRLANENIYLVHFLHRREIIGEKWMNFEEEIKRFILTIVNEMNSAPDERVADSSILFLNDYRKWFCAEVKTYKELFLRLRTEHKNLTRLLEIYMDGYINNIEPHMIKGFKKRFYNHVLTFNYTDTFAEKYEPEISCCYIHGKASLDRAIQCQMVLGFDDLNESSRVNEIEMLPYEKFFQRLDLKTSIEYLDWLKVNPGDSCQVDIIGHSLAQADGEVLRKIIMRPYTKTRIFYYDDLDRYDKLRNLTMILGPDKTISMVSGNNSQISFIPMDKYSATRG